MHGINGRASVNLAIYEICNVIICSSNWSPYKIQCNIVALTGLPIGYGVMVALTGLPIVALTGLPIGYSVIVALSKRSPYRIQCNGSSYSIKV